MKYRRLTNEELEQLKDKFIQFLVSNTVTADDWIKVKEEDIERAESLIEIFSDIVFEDVLKKVEYLEYRTSLDLKIFHCSSEKMILKGVRLKESAQLSFMNEGQAELILDKIRNGDQDITTYAAEKDYSMNREDELFKMMEQGCLISKESELFANINAQP